MGTSNSFGGPAGGTPLVPSWLEEPDVDDQLPGQGGDESPPVEDDRPELDGAEPVPTTHLTRFTSARNSFSRFARSGGEDRVNLGRAVSRYVGSVAGGSRSAMRRMGSSRKSATRLVGFLADVASQGAENAIRSRGFDELVGRPLEDVLVGLVDYLCPPGGSVDEGIARDAFIETVMELEGEGIESLEELTVDQMATVFEIYASHAIFARLCNDIGSRIIEVPDDLRAVNNVQNVLFDFIRGGVSDALVEFRADSTGLTPDTAAVFVDRVYEQAFSIIQAKGEEAAS